MKLRITPNEKEYQGIDVEVTDGDGNRVNLITDLRLDLRLDEKPRLTVTTKPKVTVTAYLSEVDVDLPNADGTKVAMCQRCGAETEYAI